LSGRERVNTRLLFVCALLKQFATNRVWAFFSLSLQEVGRNLKFLKKIKLKEENNNSSGPSCLGGRDEKRFD